MLEFEWRYPRVDVDWAEDLLVSAYYIEGWQYDKDPGAADVPVAYRQGFLGSSKEVLDWLHQKDDFKPMEPKEGEDWGKCDGGFRLLVFDRSLFYPVTLTIDEESFSAVSEDWGLVPETLPILTQAEGGMRYRFQKKGSPKAKSLQVLIQANQILKVANFMISMSFDFDTRWTTSIACVENEDVRDPFSVRLRHVLGAAVNNRGLWAHPTFLPTIFSRHYGDEMRESRAILRSDITYINRRLGVSTARSFRPEELPDDWPEKLDFRWLITNTYARRVEVMQVREGCKWSCKSLEFLRDLEQEITKKDIINEDVSHNMQKTLEYHLSIIEGTEGRFATLQEESEASTNMLFNAINQRDSIIAQRYNDIQKKIATSTKEDSISMSTFTFITALFLPGTFICALLSLTMIQWQPEFLTASITTTSPSSSDSSSTAFVEAQNAGTAAEVSNYYWVFWAIDIPLTFLVLLGWWLWFRRAKTTWMRENNILLDITGADSDSAKSKKGNTSKSGRRSSSGSARRWSRSRSQSPAPGSSSVRSRRRSRGSRSGSYKSGGSGGDGVGDGSSSSFSIRPPRRTATWKTDDEVVVEDHAEKKSLSLRIEPVSRRSTAKSITVDAVKEKERRQRGDDGPGQEIERIAPNNSSATSAGNAKDGTGTGVGTEGKSSGLGLAGGKRLRRVTEGAAGEEDDNDEDEDRKAKDLKDAMSQARVRNSVSGVSGSAASLVADDQQPEEKALFLGLRDRLAAARRGSKTKTSTGKEEDRDLEKNDRDLDKADGDGGADQTASKDGDAESQRKTSKELADRNGERET